MRAHGMGESDFSDYEDLFDFTEFNDDTRFSQ